MMKIIKLLFSILLAGLFLYKPAQAISAAHGSAGHATAHVSSAHASPHGSSPHVSTPHTETAHVNTASEHVVSESISESNVSGAYKPVIVQTTPHVQVDGSHPLAAVSPPADASTMECKWEKDHEVCIKTITIQTERVVERDNCGESQKNHPLATFLGCLLGLVITVLIIRATLV